MAKHDALTFHRQKRASWLGPAFFFATGRTFMIFTARLAKDCLLLGLSTVWRSEGVPTAGRGLSRAGNKNFSPRPAAAIQRLTRIVTSQGGWVCVHRFNKLDLSVMGSFGMSTANEATGRGGSTLRGMPGKKSGERPT